MKYRLIYDHTGQTCNRFWGYLDSVAWAIHNNTKVYIVHWDTSIKYFTKLRMSQHVSFPLYRRWLISSLGEKNVQGILYRLFDSRIIQLLLSKVLSIFGIQLINGWDTRNKTNHIAIGERVYQLFLPNDNIIADVQKVFASNLSNNEIVVGLHIRKGDYKEWNAGKYFYEDDIYSAFMTQIEHLLLPRKTKFFIATNERVSNIITSNHSTFCVKNATIAHDLYGLSKCNYIIGAPSTFSKWAALVGKVPLYHIYDPSKEITLNDFSYLTALSPWNT